MGCTNCHKDFCQCSRPALEAARAQAAARRTHGTASKLTKAGLSFRPAPTTNVVIISKEGKPDVYLSLKPEAGQLKYRVQGKRWGRMAQADFLKRIATAYR